MNALPDLSAVIPVHDASDCIAGLVHAFRNVDDLDVEVLLVDDGSSDGSGEIIDVLARGDDRIIALHHGINLGAGVARNTGFAKATGHYTIFFDADDELQPDPLAHVVRRLAATGADLAMTPYTYRRSRVLESVAMNMNDIEIWEQSLGAADERLLPLTDAPRLLEFTNYPWNKVHLTDAYRRSGLRFGSTLVHNDILGHWHSLLFAHRVLLLNHELCTHIVERGGPNLTNRTHRGRLALFDALDETYDLLEANRELRERYSHLYWAFVMRVTSWAATTLDPTMRRVFKARMQEHLLRIDPLDFMQIRVRRSPQLADQIIESVLA